MWCVSQQRHVGNVTMLCIFMTFSESSNLMTTLRLPSSPSSLALSPSLFISSQLSILAPLLHLLSCSSPIVTLPPAANSPSYQEPFFPHETPVGQWFPGLSCEEEGGAKLQPKSSIQIVMRNFDRVYLSDRNTPSISRRCWCCY